MQDIGKQLDREWRGLQIVKQALPWRRRLARVVPKVAQLSGCLGGQHRGLPRAPVALTRVRLYQQAAVEQDSICVMFELLPMCCFSAVL